MMDTTIIREPRPYWSGISDEKLTEAGVEYREKAHTTDEPGLLLKLAQDIDDELERREHFRIRLNGGPATRCERCGDAIPVDAFRESICEPCEDEAPSPYARVRPMSAGETVEQIGKPTIYSVSGGRVRFVNHPDGGCAWMDLKCGYGYSVRVFLALDDTYTVQRVYYRNDGKGERIKGEATGVYWTELEETVYRAGMFRDSWPAGGIR